MIYLTAFERDTPEHGGSFRIMMNESFGDDRLQERVFLPLIQEEDMASPWLAYNELAWAEEWLADPADAEYEVMVYV